MSRITITPEAHRELRERIDGSREPSGIAILPGSLHEEYRGPDPIEEEWIINPPQRWHAYVWSLDGFNLMQPYAEMFRVSTVSGIPVAIFSSREPSSLTIEFEEGAIRVHERAA